MASTINLLRLLADPTRLRLLLLLEQEELSVAELQQILGMGQSRISSHLAQLKRAGVVSDRRVGKNVYYGANHRGRSLQRERVAEITRLLARELPETSRDRTSLKLVLHKRQDKAEVLRRTRREVWAKLCAGPLVEGAGTYAHYSSAAADGGRSRSRRRDTLAVAGEQGAQSDCDR